MDAPQLTLTLTPADPFASLAGLSENDLRTMLALVEGTDVEELRVSVDGATMTLRRTLPDLAAADPSALLAASPTPTPQERVDPDPPLAITSPLVGFFHPTVRLGDVVQQGHSLGTIEAMGMPTVVDAPRSGTVEEVLVKDGDPVEYGQPLLVMRAGAQSTSARP